MALHIWMLRINHKVGHSNGKNILMINAFEIFSGDTVLFWLYYMSLKKCCLSVFSRNCRILFFIHFSTVTNSFATERKFQLTVR